jgi:hypothetical protein
MKQWFFTLALAGLFLSACSTQPDPSAIQTAIVQTQSALPSSTPFIIMVTGTPYIIVVTATQPPATATPEPTSTPQQTPTSTFAKWTVAQAENAIQAAGLEFGDPRPMTKDDYGLAPMSAKEAVHFLVPSVCSDCGGRLYSFSSQDDLNRMKEYYDKLGQASAMFFSWVFVKDNILIQINGDMKDAQAKQYEAALNNMK